MKRYRSLIFSLLIIFLLTGQAVATVHLRAGFLDYKKDKIELSDGVIISKEDIKVTAPRGEIYKEEKRAVLKDGVLMEHTEGKIRSEEMTAWLEKDHYIFQDKVELDYQLENSNHFTLKAPYLKMDAGDKSFTASQGVVINYNTRILKAEKASFNDEKKILKLIENVYIQEENGDWIKSKKAEIDLSTEEEGFTADGEVEIELNFDNK